MKKISRRDLLILFAILLGFMLVVFPRVIFHGGKGGAGFFQKQTGEIYYCPMHPTYTSDRPGDCPICNMELVRREIANPESERTHSKKRKILYYRHPMGQPDTSPVPKKDSMGMDYIPVYEEGTGSMEAAGDLPGHAAVEIPPARQQLVGVKLGQVEKIHLKKELRAVGRVASSTNERTDPSSSGEAIYAALYEQDLPYVKPGDRATVVAPAFQNEKFEGEVRALDPVFGTDTRFVRARIQIEDPKGLLRPGMDVDVYLHSDLGEVLAIPKEAVLFTGERAIVFVTKGSGYFEPREVTVGTSGEDHYEVKRGLALGETVAVSGNFLIDSESRLQSALKSMAPGSAEGGHQHGA